MAILVAINVTLSYTNFNNWLDRNIGRTCRRIYNIHILQYVVYYVHITQSSVNINPCTKWLQEIRSISSFDTGDIRSRILYKKLIQVDWYNFLQRVLCFLAHVFTMQLHSVEETCMCVTRFELVGCVLAGIVLSYLLSAMFVVKGSCTRNLCELSSIFWHKSLLQVSWTRFLSMCQGLSSYETSWCITHLTTAINITLHYC